MSPRTSQLQIRVSSAQKQRLRRLAASADQDMSTYVLARVLPDEAEEFAALVSQLHRSQDPSYPFASIHDLLHRLAPADFLRAADAANAAHLSPFKANYLAAMVEHAAAAKHVSPPAWTAGVPALSEPYFAASLESLPLRLHLLRASPAAFKRRNLFVDSAVGSRV
jgi:hypothetical protein